MMHNVFVGHSVIVHRHWGGTPHPNNIYEIHETGVCPPLVSVGCVRLQWVIEQTQREFAKSTNEK